MKRAGNQIVLVGTYRAENADWIAAKRLYNLPLPKCGRLAFFPIDGDRTLGATVDVAINQIPISNVIGTPIRVSLATAPQNVSAESTLIHPSRS